MSVYSKGENKTNLDLNFFIENNKILKILIKNSFESCKILTFNFCFLGSVILRSNIAAVKSTTLHMKRYKVTDSTEKMRES